MTHAFLFAVAIFAWGGCATPPSRFYTLSASPPSAPGAMATEVSVAVGPVSVPVAVDRPQIVVTVNSNQVRLDELNRWASPLASDIARVVAENLSAMLGTPRVTLSRQMSSAADVDYRTAIEVQRFESAPGEAATLDAVWTVSRDADGRSRSGRTSTREATANASYDALAAAHSRAIVRLSQDIADAVRSLQ
jgi:uncharacterized protein